AGLIVASHPERNDARKGRKPRPHGHFSRRPEQVSDDWLWGWHAVEAALANPARGPVQRLLATEEKARQIQAKFGRIDGLEISDNGAIARLVPQGAVHQGVLLK